MKTVVLSFSGLLFKLGNTRSNNIIYPQDISSEDVLFYFSCTKEYVEENPPQTEGYDIRKWRESAFQTCRQIVLKAEEQGRASFRDISRRNQSYTGLYNFLISNEVKLIEPKLWSFLEDIPLVDEDYCYPSATEWLTSNGLKVIW